MKTRKGRDALRALLNRVKDLSRGPGPRYEDYDHVNVMYDKSVVFLGAGARAKITMAYPI